MAGQDVIPDTHLFASRIQASMGGEDYTPIETDARQIQRLKGQKPIQETRGISRGKKGPLGKTTISPAHFKAQVLFA